VILKNADSTETFFVEKGAPTDEPILFIHGIGADHQMWQPQIEAFPKQGYHILVPDMLGHGSSSKMKSLTLDDWDNQIIDLLDHKDIEKCTMIGVSMGGVIAQHFTTRHPERVKRLVLSDTFGELKTFREKMLGLSQVIGFRLYKMLGAKLLAKGMASAYKAPFAEKARAYFAAVSLKADFDQLILARRAINQIDAIGRIDGSRIPTLVMVGAEFGEMFIKINKKIAEMIYGAKFVVLEKSMDPSNLVNPEVFNQEVFQFLKNPTDI
jgi:pimeloyl-ACP methyl ester carboxylesterase